jgi:hypothetical protein
MAKVWVRAKTILNVEEDGKRVQYHPGDWCRMGRHQAKEYLQSNQIDILKSAILQTVQDLTDCAILLRGMASEQQSSVLVAEQRRSLMAAKYPGVPIEEYTGYPDKYGRFLIWDQSAELRHDLILTGFHLLSKWQIAAPLLDYNILAESVGTAEERKETKVVIHDLRVPVYDSRVLFVRQCRETRKLFKLWAEGDDLAFLRALYQTRPIINALPPSWILRA